VKIGLEVPTASGKLAKNNNKAGSKGNI